MYDAAIWATARTGKAFSVTVFLAAFFVRAAYVVTLNEDLRFADSIGYDALAKNLRAGKGLVFDETHQIVRPPFYPIFLAACYELFGTGLLMPRLAQCAVSAAMCLVVFLLASRLFDERAGMLAATLCVFYPFFIFYTGLILTETFFACVLAALVLALVHLRGRGDAHGAAWAGLALGVSVLLRPSMLMFIPFLLPFWIVCAGWRRDAVKSFAVLVAAVAIVLTPWVWRNYVVTGGRFVPTTLLVGKSLYEANSDYATGGPAMHLVRWPPEIERMSEYDADRYMKAKAVEWIKSHPGRFVELVFVKLGRFWNLFPNFEEYRSTPYLLLSLFSFGPVLALAGWGLWRARGQWRQTLLLLTPIFYFSLLHSVFVGSIRYRMPIEPLLIVMAAYALSAWLWGPQVATGLPSGSEGAGLSPVSARLRRRLTTMLVLGALAAGGVAIGQVARQPDWLRRRIEESLSRGLNAPARIGRLTVGLIGGTNIQDFALRFTVPGCFPSDVKARQMYVHHRLSSMLRGGMKADFVELRSLDIQVRLSPETHVEVAEVIKSVARLLSHLGGPNLAVSRGQLHVLEGERSLVELSDLDLLITPEEKSAEMFSVRATWRDKKLGWCTFAGRLGLRGPTLNASIRRKDKRVAGKLIEDVPALGAGLMRGLEIGGGTADLRLDIAYDPLTAKDVKYALVGHLSHCSFTHRKFPYPVTELGGAIELTGKRLSLSGVKGRVGRADFRVLDGTVALSPNAGFQIAAFAEKVALDDTLRAALSGDLRDQWDLFRPRGSVDVVLTVMRDTGESQPTRVQARVACRECSIAYGPFPLPVSAITGAIEITNHDMRFSDMKGKSKTAALKMADAIVKFEPGAPFLLKFEAEDLALDRDLRAALPPSFHDVWDSLAPSGPTDIEWQITRPSGGEIVHKLAVNLKGCSVAYRPFPFPVSNLRGRASYEQQKLTLHSLIGWHGKTSLKADGTVSFEEGGAKLGLDVAAQDVELTPDLGKTLPPAYLDTWEALKPSGPVDVTMKLSLHRVSSGGPRAALCTGDVHFKGCSFVCGLHARDAKGNGSFRVDVDERGQGRVQGSVWFSEVRFSEEKGRAERKLTDLHAKFREESNAFHIDDLEARAFNGVVTGSAYIKVLSSLEDTTYSARFSLRDLELERLVKEGDLSPKSLTGILRAETQFEGRGAVGKNLSGSGKIEVRKGQLGELPTLLGLLNLFHLAPVGAPAFHSANLDYQLEGERIFAKRIDLIGQTLSLYGKGELNKETGELNFRFVPELNVGPKLPVVDGILDKTRLPEFVDKIKGAVVPVKLGGTYEDPVWQLDPLISFNKLIQGIFKLRESGARKEKKP